MRRALEAIDQARFSVLDLAMIGLAVAHFFTWDFWSGMITLAIWFVASFLLGFYLHWTREE